VAKHHAAQTVSKDFKSVFVSLMLWKDFSQGRARCNSYKSAEANQAATLGNKKESPFYQPLQRYFSIGHDRNPLASPPADTL